MGQKVHPIGFRLGVSKDWASKWYAEGKDYANFLEKDFEVREFIRKKLAHASVSQIQIERPRNGAQITIFTARPGIVIGRKGEDIEVLKREISAIMGVPTSVNIEEIRRPELDAYLVADGIAKQLERRVMFRRAMKRSVASTMRLGAAGIKVSIAGRLNGAEIAGKDVSLYVHCVQILIMGLRKHILRMVLLALRYGFLRVRIWKVLIIVPTQRSARCQKKNAQDVTINLVHSGAKIKVKQNVTT